MNNKGKHAIADIYLDQFPPFDQFHMIIHTAAHESYNVLDQLYRYFGPGETFLFLLAESHISVHTYPEHNYLSVDVYTCGDAFNPELFIDRLFERLPVKKITRNLIERG